MKYWECLEIYYSALSGLKYVLMLCLPCAESDRMRDIGMTIFVVKKAAHLDAS